MQEICLNGNEPVDEMISTICNKTGLPEITARKLAMFAKNIFRQVAPQVYICSPLAENKPEGIRRNMLAARAYIQAAEHECSVIGKAPHAYLPEFLNDNDPSDRKIALAIGIKVLNRCLELYVCGNKLTNGMIDEIRYAFCKGIPVRVFNVNLLSQVKAIARITDVPAKRAVILRGNCGLLAFPAEFVGNE